MTDEEKERLAKFDEEKKLLIKKKQEEDAYKQSLVDLTKQDRKESKFLREI
eukprot:CAMPEP_0170497642 /NCGR_PEP_ID=MMETSP0208-20121228/25324_1 /TAXON_ID=197538 /ORGANISM="Strombidium inclinatum, Strain S3" /LENGTH=50 /DNA_ID=CAMNT_0010774515 /DNA_START=377 /DNA_END=529 /DNA_ORIENTATION=+